MGFFFFFFWFGLQAKNELNIKWLAIDLRVNIDSKFPIKQNTVLYYQTKFHFFLIKPELYLTMSSYIFISTYNLMYSILPLGPQSSNYLITQPFTEKV